MPSVSYVLSNDTFKIWREITNSIIDEVDTKLTINNNLSDLDNATNARQNLGVEIGVDVAQYIKNNYSATSAPTVNDDADSGYSVGSLWIDTSSPNEAYRCTDNTVGAAEWVNTSLEIDELGSMATQDANDVNITDGSIDPDTVDGVESESDIIALIIALG